VDCKVGVGTCAFPTAVVKALLARNITPVIWWLPMDPSDKFSSFHGRYKKILKHRHDAYIRQWAVAARQVGRQTGKRVIVRFAHEATGFWFPWSVHRGTNSYDNYKKAWNYIGKKFEGLKARKHVLFMWANVWPMKKAFPGDRFVDFVGVTVLNFGSQRRWKTPQELLKNRAKSSRAITRKPIIIAEMGTHYKGGSKGNWINTAYKFAYNKNPSIRGIMYLETDQPHIARNQPDWRLAVGDGGAGMKAYRAIARQNKFKGRIR
jgi:beta-mannanase